MIKANIITDCFKWTNKIPNKKIYLKNKLKILSLRDAVNEIITETELPRRVVYKEAIKIKNDMYT